MQDLSCSLFDAILASNLESNLALLGLANNNIFNVPVDILGQLLVRLGLPSVHLLSSRLLLAARMGLSTFTRLFILETLRHFSSAIN